MQLRPLLLATALYLAAQTAHAQQVRYTLELRAEKNDNLLLEEVDPVSTTILRPGIEFDIHHETSALQVAMAGRMHYYNYNVDRVDNAVEGLLDGRVDWYPIPERLSFTLQDSLSMQPIDTVAADVPGNRQRVNIFSAGPTLHFHSSPTSNGELELRYVDTTAEVNDDFNSSRTDLALRLEKSLTPTDRISGHVQWQSVRFDVQGSASDYRRNDVFARYRHRAARYELTADAGVTRLTYDSGGRNRNNPLYRLQTAWTPAQDHRLSVRWSRQYSDVAAWALDRLDGEVRPTEGMSMNLVVANASPFTVRQTDLEYSYLRDRWSLVLAPYVNRLRYVETSDFDHDGRGYAVDLGYLLRDNLRIGAGSSWDKNDYVVTQRSEKVRRHRLHLEYQFTRHWLARVEAGRYARKDSAFGRNLKQGTIAISIAYTNF